MMMMMMMILIPQNSVIRLIFTFNVGKWGFPMMLKNVHVKMYTTFGVPAA